MKYEYFLNSSDRKLLVEKVPNSAAWQSKAYFLCNIDKYNMPVSMDFVKSGKKDGDEFRTRVFRGRKVNSEVVTRVGYAF